MSHSKWLVRLDDWTGGERAATFPVYNPATGESIAEVAEVQTQDPAQAASWYRKAIAAGFEAARPELAALLEAHPELAER